MNTKHQPFDTGRAANVGMAQRPSAPIATELLVRFEPGLKALPTPDSKALENWTDHWLRHEPDAMIVMACAGPKHRSARVARLRSLRGLLAGRGVAEERIRYTGDLIEAPGVAAGMEHSSPLAATARLKLVDARRAERQVCSIRSMFNLGHANREVACTSAS